MKKNLFYPLALFALLLTIISCNSDDDNNSSNDPIIGNWDVIELGYSYEDVVTGDTGEEVFEGTICNPNPTMTFSANGNATLTDMSFDVDTEDNTTCEVLGTLNGDWIELNNNIYAITFKGETLEMTAVFSNNDNKVTITAQEQDEDEINETFLTLERQ